MAMGEKMTRLVPNSHMGWHCRGWAAEEYGAMAKGYDAAVKATADDDKEHKVPFLYRYIDCIMRRGHFRMGDMRKLYMEARQLEKDIRPLGLRHHSEEKATVKHLMKSTPASEDHRVCKKGLVNVSYSSEEEYQGGRDGARGAAPRPGSGPAQGHAQGSRGVRLHRVRAQVLQGAPLQPMQDRQVRLWFVSCRRSCRVVSCRWSCRVVCPFGRDLT
jgi:hypothetical protein